MQRILNVSILLILAIFFSSPVCAQSEDYDSESESLISLTASSTNYVCPFEMANGLTCTSVIYDPVRKELVYTIDTDPILFPYDAVVANVDSSKTSAIDFLYGSSDTQLLLNAIMNVSGSLVYDYKYPDSRHIKVIITDDDIRNAGARTEADIVSTALYNLNRMIKADTYPMEVDKITTLQEVFIKGDKFCYRYTINSPIPFPSEAGVANLRESIENNMLRNASAHALVSNTINAGLTMEHTYTCSSWTSPLVISFTPEQLKTILGI